MKWRGLGKSTNIQDLRAKSFSSGGAKSQIVFFIIRILLRTRYGRIFLFFAAVIWGIFSLMGYNPLQLLEKTPTNYAKKSFKQEKKKVEFVSVVLAQTEKVWSYIFTKNRLKYKEPKLLLFRKGIESGCGYASSHTGPFYCPNDKKIYLDLSFFDALSHKYNAKGDFAEAYVIAHEVGHHVQNLLGMLEKSNRLKKKISTTQANALSVQVELQADCYAGLWAHYLENVLEKGDIQEALEAASAIGDDTLQKRARGYVTPESFTHGSSAQRMKWFLKGYETGTLESCKNSL